MIREVLAAGRIDILGRHPHASNQVFLADVTFGDDTVRVLYKPIAGERPLWDFPRGELARREVAAFAVSEAMGLHLVPLTVWREDAPLGAGSLQRWIEAASIDDVGIVRAAEPGWVSVLDAELEDGTEVQVVHRDLPELRATAFLDAVLNNGDRKAGHLLRDEERRLWVVDHGVTFHADPKLRSVLWGFEGEPITSELLATLELPIDALPEVRAALDHVEILALRRRIADLRDAAVFPGPSKEWPAIPWPVF